jgi:hypothetical protein
VLGASARYGRESRSIDGELLPPLVYSTELARSTKLSYATAIREIATHSHWLDAADAEIKASERDAKFQRLEYTPISTDLIYGMINVRTDGRRVLCGYLKEDGKDFDIEVFDGGAEPEG